MWCRQGILDKLENLIFGRMLVTEERRHSAANVYMELESICEEMQKDVLRKLL